MKLIAIVMLLLSVGCSSLSKNSVKTGAARFTGGVYKDQSWQTEIGFARYSWFNELTLLLDVLVTKVEPFDPFYQWFSVLEKEMMRDCADFKVAMVYALDPSRLSEREFLNQAADVGYQRVPLPQFRSYLRMHPEYDRQSFQLYSVYGLCQKRGASAELEGSKIPVAMPSFNEVEIF